MHRPDANDDDPFTARLVDYDEALAQGTKAGEDTASAAGGEAKLRRAKAVLDQLEELWPRRQRAPSDTHGSSDTLVDATPAELGRFRIERELGRGGGGIVYLAYDPRLQRQVALKVPRPESLFTPDLRRRFLREAEAAAQLDHQNIVPIHESGEVGGVCYLVSTYCSGPNLADWLRSRSVPPRQAAQIVAALASGVAHMHTRGILHRDIKPRNVLLEHNRAHDSAGELGFVPRLTDFGLAKWDAAHAGTAEPAERDMTRTGAIIGTPAYMAPEQAEGRLDRIGPVTDVYALGVLLYELLTGRTPFQGNSDADTLRRIVSVEPTALRKLRREVPRDLDTICLKCLHRDPGRRYDSALDLARDLQRYLNGEPIRARPTGTIAQSWRWLRRHPAAALAIVSILALLLTLPGLVWYDMRLNQAQQVAETQELYRLLFQVKERRQRHPAGWTWKNLRELQRAAQLKPSGPDLPLLRSEQAAALAGVDVRLARSVAPGFLAHEAAFSPDGKLLALAQGIGDTADPMRVLLVDPFTGDVLRELVFPSYQDEWQKVAKRAEATYALTFSPEGRWLVVGMRSGHIHRWDLNLHEANATSWKAHGVDVLQLAFTGESRRLCSLDRDGAFKTWVIDRQWQEELVPSIAKVTSMVALSAEGLLACHNDGQVTIYDSETLTSFNRWSCPGQLLAAAPDGQTLVVTDPAGRAVGLAVRKADSGTVVSSLLAAGHRWPPAFSGDGSLLAQVTRSLRQLNVWDMANARLMVSTVVPRALNCVAFHPDGALLAVPAEDQTYLYEVRRSRVQEVGSMLSVPVRNMAFGTDNMLWSAEEVSTPIRGVSHCVSRLTASPIQSRRLARAYSPWLLPEHVATNSANRYVIALHPRRELMVCATSSQIWCRDLVGNSVFALDSVECVNDLSFDSAGTLWVADHFKLRLASAFPGSLRTIWQSDAEEQGAGNTLQCVAAAAQGVLVGQRDGKVRWFDQERLAGTWKICSSEVRCLAISADGHYALAGTELGKVCLMTLAAGDIICRFPDHGDCVTGAAFLGPDVIATASRDGTIRLCRTDGTPLLTLDVPGPVLRMHVSADGTQLAAAIEGERAARLWHLDQLSAEMARLGLPLGVGQLRHVP